MPKQVTLNNSQITALKWDGKDRLKPTQYAINSLFRLYLFCYESGKKIFYYKTKNRKMVKIGEYPKMTLKEASIQASLYLDNDNGLDSVIIEKRKEITLKEIYKICFDEAYVLPENKNSEEYDRAFRRKKDANKHIFKWILNKIGDIQFSKLNEKSIIDAFTRGCQAPSKDVMNKNLAVLNEILIVAKRKQLIDNYTFLTLAKKELNEVLTDKAPKHHKGLIGDDFELDEKAVSMLIKVVLGSNTSLSAKLLFAFMLLSPQRQGDLRSLRCERVNLEKGFISFNESNNKTGAIARIPLSLQGSRILKIASKISGSKYIFSSSDKPLSENTLNKLIKDKGIDFTIHSLRTTFGTAIQASDELGHNSMYRKKIADIVMLHTTQSSVDMAYFMESAKQSEILEVLQFWADKIEKLGLDIDSLEKQSEIYCL